MSTNRTLVERVAVESVAAAERRDLGVDSPLLLLEADKLAVPLGEGSQVLGDQRAHGAAALRGVNARGAIDLVGHGDGEILHPIIVTQFHRNT